MVRAGLSEWYLAFSVNELLLTQHAAWGVWFSNHAYLHLSSFEF